VEKFKYLTKNKISDLPETPGVYAFKKTASKITKAKLCLAKPSTF